MPCREAGLHAVIRLFMPHPPGVAAQLTIIVAIVITVVVVIKEERLEAFCEVLRMCVHKVYFSKNIKICI